MYLKKLPSSIQFRDSNSRPLKHETPPITTRPQLTPYFLFIYRLVKAAERVYRTRIFSEFTILKVLVKKVSILSNRDFRYRNEPLARRFNQKQTQCDLKWGQKVAKIAQKSQQKFYLKYYYFLNCTQS